MAILKNNFSIVTNDKGQALLEMAIALPVFFLIILGFLQIGLAIEKKQKLVYVTNYATQVGSLTNNDLKISGAIEEFFNASEISFFIENKNSNGDSISTLDRRYNDILTIKTEVPLTMTIPLLDIPILNLSASSSARILCVNQTTPYTCE
jgi:hypothetical protein